MINTLRFRSRWEDADANTHELEAGYSLRAATKSMGSDFVYTKHSTVVAYTFRHVKQGLKFSWLTGLVNGNAPIYDRFALGNSTTLRGWNKYELAPLGGARMVHGSVEYRFKMLEAFYDTGSIWDRGQRHNVKHSVGAGIRKDALQLAIAFPVRSGHIDPVFIAGVNF